MILVGVVSMSSSKVCNGDHAEDNNERKFAMYSLGATSVKELKLRTLDWAVNSGQVKLQDFFYPIGACANRYTRDENAQLCYS